MADIEAFVAQRTTCEKLHLEAEDPDEESVGEEWGIKERAVCYDADGRGITLLSIDDMKQFQTTAKEHGGGYLVGQDFALDAPLRVRPEFQGSGLLYLNCDPDDPIPSGYQTEPALVAGCQLTAHIS